MYIRINGNLIRAKNGFWEYLVRMYKNILHCYRKRSWIPYREIAITYWVYAHEVNIIEHPKEAFLAYLTWRSSKNYRGCSLPWRLQQPCTDLTSSVWRGGLFSRGTWCRLCRRQRWHRWPRPSRPSLPTRERLICQTNRDLGHHHPWFWVSTVPVAPRLKGGCILIVWYYVTSLTYIKVEVGAFIQ